MCLSCPDPFWRGPFRQNRSKLRIRPHFGVQSSEKLPTRYSPISRGGTLKVEIGQKVEFIPYHICRFVDFWDEIHLSKDD